MKTITSGLFAITALLLCVSALVVGSFAYAAGAAALLSLVFAARRLLPGSRLADPLLVVGTAISAGGLFFGVPPASAAAAMSLLLFDWNAAHRFAQTETAPTTPRAEARLALQYLVRSIPFSLALGLLIGTLPLLDLRLAFAPALLVSVSALALVALFVRLARTTSDDVS